MNEFANRRIFITVAIVLMCVVMLVRIFYIQVIDTSYRRTAEMNTLRYEVQYPARGLIYDRNGALLVGNQTVYDIMVVPREVAAFDTLALSQVLRQSAEQIGRRVQEIKAAAQRAAAWQPTLFARQVSAAAFALLQEKWFKFPGFYAQARSIRLFQRPIGGNLIGYIGEADTSNISADNFYTQGSYVGKTGIERSYEKALRGKRGVAVYMRDVLNRVRNSYADGRLDSAAVAGSDFVCTIDADLQEYGERLMRNKVGSIVAIEPSTGEILALVSSPTYDPMIFSDINRMAERAALAGDPLKPLFNRAVMAQYPPGSIFKTVNSLAALQERTATPRTTYVCHGAYYYGRSSSVGCHAHFKSSLDMVEALQVSCNTYYCNLFRTLIERYPNAQEGLNAWRRHVLSFGFGQKLNTDIPNEQRGIVPTTSTYDRQHGVGRWKALSVISLAIGQGELGVTPLHMANLAAAIANRGHYYTPHLAKAIAHQKVDPRFLTPHNTTIDPSYFETVVEGMFRVVNSPIAGTARNAKIPGIDLCGKTGTAENPHGEDHSVFICFAPRREPKIALSVYVENGGSGARWAAPIASLMVEKYLNKTVSQKWQEERVLNADLIHQPPVPPKKSPKKPTPSHVLPAQQ